MDFEDISTALYGVSEGRGNFFMGTESYADRKVKYMMEERHYSDFKSALAIRDDFPVVNLRPHLEIDGSVSRFCFGFRAWRFVFIPTQDIR